MISGAGVYERDSKAAWLAAMILGFIAYWPIGLTILGYLAMSGRLSAWKQEKIQRKIDRWMSMRNPMGPGTIGETAFAQGFWNCAPRARNGYASAQTPSGNAAFDQYREETLKRLEEEQREFREYLERLRQAKDRTEFEQFMAERRSRATPQ